ncbi:MAG: 3-hydroxyacyl-CoA dehydrogenase family protein [Bacillota bacterium]
MNIQTVGVVGAGLMGHGIAQMAAKGGYQVILADISENELQKGYKQIENNLNKDVQKGKVTEQQAQELLNRISITLDLTDLKNCDAIIESIPEIMELKKHLFTTLDAIVKNDAILITNTSQLSITEMASVTSRPQNFVGMHFFYPASIMKLVEIPVGEHTCEACIQAVVELGRHMGKETCVCKDTPGFIVNRILAGLLVEASRVYDENLASVEEIDKAIRFGLGHPMGPFQLFDMSGIDTILKAADGLRATLGDRFLMGVGVRNKVRAGDFGQKTGRGFYNYKAD